MSPPRAHVDATVLDAVDGTGLLTLPTDAAHRFARVLRLVDGAAVELFDGTGRVARGVLAGAALRDVVIERGVDPLPPLFIAQAVTKTDKLELVIKKGTELGASGFVLVDCARGQVHLGERADKRRERLQRVADDAARQSGRASVPLVEGPIDVDALALRVRGFAGVCAMGVVGAPGPLSEALRGERLAQGGLLIVVGPEGGLDANEVARLSAAGAVSVRLGAHVLRTETAGLAALAAAQVALGLL